MLDMSFEFGRVLLYAGRGPCGRLLCLFGDCDTDVSAALLAWLKAGYIWLQLIALLVCILKLQRYVQTLHRCFLGAPRVLNIFRLYTIRVAASLPLPERVPCTR